MSSGSSKCTGPGFSSLAILKHLRWIVAYEFHGVDPELVDNYTDPVFTGYTRDFANPAVPLPAVGGQRYRNGKIIYSVAKQQRPGQNRHMRLIQRFGQQLCSAPALW